MTKLIRKKSFRIGYISGGHFDVAAWGKTQSEAIQNLKFNFIALVASKTHKAQIKAEKNGEGYSFDYRFKKRMEWELEYLKYNTQLICEFFETEGTQDDYDNSVETETVRGYWSPKYPIKLGV